MIIEEGVVELLGNINSQTTTIKIPSHKYPLNSAPEGFDSTCTSDVTDEKIIEIFDAAKYEIGKCYSNSERLANALQEAGYNAKCYVGWMFLNDFEPIHHACVVVDEIHVLDLSTERDYIELERQLFAKGLNAKEVRYQYAKTLARRRRNPHSTHNILGKIPEGTLYIGCPCCAKEGIRIYNKLIRAFPKHPCNCTDNGVDNEIQRMLKNLSEKHS